MSDMLIVVPVLQRPHVVQSFWEAWESTTVDADVVMAIDEDDPTLPNYLEVVKDTGITLRVGEPLWTAPKLNQVVAEHVGSYPFIGFWGDDNRPRTYGWDKRFRSELTNMGTGMVYANDLLQRGELPCSVVMTSDIPKALGYMAFPEAKHLNIDVVWRDWGQAINRYCYLDDIIIEHMHSANGKAPLDYTYRKGNSKQRVDEDTAAYFRYRQNQFAGDLQKLYGLIN